MSDFILGVDDDACDFDDGALSKIAITFFVPAIIALQAEQDDTNDVEEMNHIYVLPEMIDTVLNGSSLMDYFNISQSKILVSLNNRSYEIREIKLHNETEKSCECDFTIPDWFKSYAQYHGHLAIIVCIFGTFTNLINVAVLTRKDMACAPINRILTGLAVADMMLMIEYMPFAYYYHVELPEKLNYPFSAAVFVLFHIHFTQILHTISICLTLTLAIWRYLAIGHPDKNHILCSEARCTLGIFLSYVLPIFLCGPTYFAFQVKATTIKENDTDYILYHTALSDTANNEEYLVFYFWMYSVVMKLIPCTILTVISVWLVRTLHKAKKRKQVLREYNNTGCMTKQLVNNKKKTKAERRADRTTKMLVAVLLLFLITEFPQGVLGLLSGMKGKCFFLKCYQDFGDIIDMLALLNGSINFVLYCCMNRMFRATFEQMFTYRILSKWVTPVQSEIHTTYV
ncbi:myosuppressin receptor 1 isoform b-related [Holotrichia oblita]|uniref:Myosuppressin receptor 1 isoform b-related n=1 Tax=Holotrichia oblita TaxID=644536 RepID=A0ACB9TKC4_HOLOL|nr:myosuppressin receptor 1 isoform b-related [Holotrichia oblita]